MNFIKKVNTYFLERYPIIWNTRFVWMIGISVVTHILFFLTGYFSVNNQIDIASKYHLANFYFDTPVMLFNILLSFIILLIWIIYYLQNNAFKNHYVLKKGSLFIQYSIIVITVFININQFYSFNEGLKLKIRNLYAWEEVDRDIKAFNKTGLFLNIKSSDYNIENKMYPAPFPLKTVKVGANVSNAFFNSRIDASKAYIEEGNESFQFYVVDKEKIKKDFKGTINQYYSERRLIGDFQEKLKYRIVKDVSYFKDDIKPCLLNYSKKMFSHGQKDFSDKARYAYYENILNNADELEIKAALQSFLNLANKYNVKNNLNIPDWYAMLSENNYTYNVSLIEKKGDNYVYEERRKFKSRKNFQINKFILNSEPSKEDTREVAHHFTKKIIVEKRLISNIGGRYTEKGYIPSEKIYSKFKEVKLKETPYCDLGRLDTFFSNIYASYQSYNEAKGSINFYLLVSFFLSIVLFLFKVTNIKTLLLTAVTAAVLLILMGLLMNYIPNSLKRYRGMHYVNFLIADLILLSVIISSAMAFKLRWNKLITAILFSLGLFAVPVFMLVLYFMFQEFLSYEYSEHSLNVLWIEKYYFLLMMFVTVLSIAVYTKAIRKWKGLPG